MSDEIRESNEGEPSSKKAKRQLTVATAQKWQTTNDKEYQTLTWLKFKNDRTNSNQVRSLYCDICSRYSDHLQQWKTFSETWIEGSTNFRISNIQDHAKSEQHKRAMNRFRIDAAKASNQPLTSYSPLARSLCVMGDDLKKRMERKFDMAYVIAKEGLGFTKYPAIYELEARHGVDLGHAYQNRDSVRLFIKYIAESQRQQFMSWLKKSCLFFSTLMDTTTDAGNIEDELFVLLFCKKDDATKRITSCTRYLCVQKPERVDAQGLVNCLETALTMHGFRIENSASRSDSSEPLALGVGTDGASANISGKNGMRGILQRQAPWLFWSWCFAHRVELAAKDSFSSRLFKDVVDMLLRLFYIYEKSPKKSRELATIAEELKVVFELPKGGNAPIRAHGSRWISHKRKAMQRIVDRFGVYMSHLTSLSQDPSLKVEDRARLSGCLKKWCSARILYGCAFYVEALKPLSILSLALQEEDLDCVHGIKQILGACSALRNLAQKDPMTWPMVKLVSDRIKSDNEDKEYQGAVLKDLNDTTLQECQSQVLSDVDSLQVRIQERLEWSDLALLRSLLVFLDTQNWVCRKPDTNTEGDLTEIVSAVEHIKSVFQVPLEAKGVDLSSLLDELEAIVSYARKHLSISTEDYKSIWYKLHTCPDHRNWTNVLLICQLGFSLPFSNARVEQIFSSLKVLKTDRRTTLSIDTLNDLLEIYIEGCPLRDFSADNAVSLWWSACSRRTEQSPRMSSTQSSGESGTSVQTPQSEEDQPPSFEEWDAWFGI